MALLEKSCLNVDVDAECQFIAQYDYIDTGNIIFYSSTFRDITWVQEDFSIKFKTLFDLFSDPLSPTQEECTMFNLEYGVEYIIKPEERECNTSE